MKANQAAFDAGQLAERLSQGYYSHLAAIMVAMDPRAIHLAPAIRPGHHVSVADVRRKDGTAHVFHFPHYLARAANDPLVAGELERIWLAGALLRLGDVLAQHRYFDRAPELELLRHLRNGVAHGNRFNITDTKSLKKYPAHNRLAAVRGDLKPVFEVEPSLHGQEVLFNFMGARDVLDLIMSVGLYLIRMGNGEALRP